MKNIAWAQLGQGVLALHEGDYERARAAFTASLGPLHALHDSVMLSVALASLADIAREQGEMAEATALYEKSLALCGDLDITVSHLGDVHYRLGEIALDQGAWAQAQTHLAASVRATQHWRQGEEWQMANVAKALEGYGALAAAQGAPRRAVRLAGAAAALRKRSARPLSPQEQRTQERRLAPARQALSPEEQAAAWAEGQALTLEQAIAYALEDGPKPQT